MSNRIELGDEMLVSVAGGNIQYVNNGSERYAWGSHNPGKKYAFPSKSRMLSFIDAHYDELGEKGCIAAMVDEGILIPM